MRHAYCVYVFTHYAVRTTHDEQQYKNIMTNIAVFASGSGSNFQAIVKAIKKGKIQNAQVKLLVCDNPAAFVLKRARKAGVRSFLVELKDFKTKDDYEQKILEELKKEDIQLIALAGYMKIVGNVLVDAFLNKIINIHPALLPSFKGAHGIKDAFEYGVKLTGVTVHFVDKEMDHGPIIMQKEVKIEESDTLESLEKKIHKVEHKIYPESINLFAEGRLKAQGRKVTIV